MVNGNSNLWLTIIKSIFVPIHIGSISLGLVSCGINQPPSPPAIEKPSVNSEQSPAQTGQDKDDDDEQDDGGDDDEKDNEQQNTN